MLTEGQIKNAKPGEKAYLLPDRDGLFLYVTPAGAKSWRARPRVGGKQKSITFGKYPAIGLAQARVRNLESKKLIANDVDPTTHKKAIRRAAQEEQDNSFLSVSQLWIKHWSVGKSQQHVMHTQARLDKNMLPSLGNRPINQIAAKEIVQMARVILDRGSRDIAKRSLETSGQIFRFAVAHGYAERNPVADIKPGDILPPHIVNHHARVSQARLPELLRAIETFSGTWTTRIAMKLLALTFVRVGELVAATWDEFDLDKREWRIPAERMKMRSEHIVYLADQTLSLLRMMKEKNDADTGLSEGAKLYVFPTRHTGSKNKHINKETITKALVDMGFGGQMTAHGFRGVASTILHEQEFDHQHIELQLAHAPRDAVSAAYNHALYLPQRKKMMIDWANYLDAAVRGGTVINFPSVKKMA